MRFTTLIVDDARLVVPDWVDCLDEFRRWADEPDFPEKGNVWWLHGGVWADMSKEQVFTHVLVKTRITSVLDNLVTENDLGLIFSDGLRVTNLEANLSGNPDATFVSNESRREGRVRFIEGLDRGYTEIVGSPDMVLEVVSDSSETKDLETLREDYFVAGIQEYWLVDARGKNLGFEILRRNKTGFVVTRKQSGWMKSSVFGKSFRLLQELDPFGDPKYRLEIK